MAGRHRRRLRRRRRWATSGRGWVPSYTIQRGDKEGVEEVSVETSSCVSTSSSLTSSAVLLPGEREVVFVPSVSPL